MKTKIYLSLCVLLVTSIFTANITAGENAENSKTYALVVCGIIKDAKEEVSRAQVVSQLQQFLIDNTAVTNETIEFIYPNQQAEQESNPSTAEIIQQTIMKFAQRITLNDNFIFYYIGQANIIGENLRFNIPGQDLIPDDIADMLSNIKAASTLIVLDCPSASAAIKALSAKDSSEPNQPETQKIIIGSSTSEQHYATRFTSFFLPAFTESKSDTNEDGKVSLLEAFTAASMAIDKWYMDNKMLSTETPVLEDNGDTVPSEQPWEYMLGGTDGRAASEYFLVIDQEGI